MVAKDSLSAQLTMFGEHDYPENTSPKDPGGRLLAHQHNAPKQYRHDLDPVQQKMTSEEGVRQLNTMQKFTGVV